MGKKKNEKRANKFQQSRFTKLKGADKMYSFLVKGVDIQKEKIKCSGF